MKSPSTLLRLGLVAICIGFIASCSLLSPATYQADTTQAASLTPTVAQLQTQLTAAQSANQQLQATLTAQQAQLNGLTASAATQPANAALTAQITALQASLAQTQIAATTAQSQAAGLQAQLNILQPQLTAATQAIANNNASLAGAGAAAGTVATIGALIPPPYGTLIAAVAAAIGIGVGYYKNKQNNVTTAGAQAVIQSIDVLKTAGILDTDKVVVPANATANSPATTVGDILSAAQGAIGKALVDQHSTT